MQAVLRARPVCEFGLDLCAFLLLPMLVLASRGVAPLAAVAGVCALGVALPGGTDAWRRVRGVAVLLGALVGWGLLSSLWAIEPRRSLIIALRLAGMFLAGLALIAAANEIAAPARLMRWLAVGLATALVLAVAQFASDGALTAALHDREFYGSALNQAEDGIGFLLLPLCAALAARRRYIVAAALGVAAAAVMFVLVGNTARIGFVVGIAAAGLFYACRRWMARAGALASAVLILAAPVIFPPLGQITGAYQVAEHFKNSLWHRLQIWAFVGGRIDEKPLFGWGLDSSRAIPGGNAPIARGYPGQTVLPLHPHNAPLQLWLELGLPGAVLFAMIVAGLWLRLGRAGWPPLYAAAAGGSLVTALVVAVGSYGVWQEWLVSCEFLTLFLILAMAKAGDPKPRTPTL